MHLHFVATMLAAMPLADAALPPMTAEPMTADRAIKPAPRPNAQTTTPVLNWQGVSAVRTLCLVAPDTFPGRRDVQRTLCDRVAALASVRSPFKVSPIGFGDPAILDRDTATLLVHASVERAARDGGDGTTIVFSIRVFRNAGVGAETFFGAAPRIVYLPGPAITGRALDAAIEAALREVVPWRQGTPR